MKKTLIIEGIIIVILIIIISRMPSHRALTVVNERSLTYEHAAAKAEAIAENSDGTPESITKINPERAKAGVAAYENGISTEVDEDIPSVPTQDPIGPDANVTPSENDPDATITPGEGDKNNNDSKKDDKNSSNNKNNTDNKNNNDDKNSDSKNDKNNNDNKKDNAKATNTPSPTPTKKPEHKSTGKTCVVTATSLRLRSRPDYSDDHNAVFLAVNGEVLEVVSTDVPTEDKLVTEWVEVYYKERYLYVPLQYVEMQ